MNTDSMSFCYEEHFPTYEHLDFFPINDELQSEDFNNSTVPHWDWEVEQEINGDIALIPMSSNIATNYLSSSSPIREDFQKVMGEWHQFTNLEVSELDVFATGIPLTDICENMSEFEQISSQKMNKAASQLPGKRIDVNAQCYIINNASEEIDNSSIKEDTKSGIETTSEALQADKLKIEDNDSENDFIDVDTVTNINTPILQAGDVNSLLEQFEATESYQPKSIHNNGEIIKEEVKLEPENDSVDKNKQILDALPQELIMKIKASSKRRVVPLIDAMPNKKRIKKKENELPRSNMAIVTQDDLENTIKNEFVQLDHDYCSQSTPYPKHPQKDSGFESAEEDEQRSILKKQPTVKGADGKLMISLLKVNTIRNSIITDNNKIKRKLNLEEYKKRREGVIKIKVNSRNSSPTRCDAASPTVVEDENVRLLKHQKKLMQMAEEVLKTPSKNASVSVQNSVIQSSQPPISLGICPPRILPNNIEVKTLVSMGVNTVISHIQRQPTELEDIKPILQSAHTKINDNSLITSVIKNMQKMKSGIVSESNNSKKEVKNEEHGEDKIIAYLDKGRPSIKSRNVEVQTEPEIEDTTKHKRKRNISCSSNSGEQRKLCKERSCSTDSHYSYSSESSSSSSRSRSRSPRRTYFNKRPMDLEKERVREVEERRIVYVGGISSSVTKDYLRRRFQVFGSITNISVHFREYGDNYGFVTFVHKADAYRAIEHGNDDPLLPKYDLSFGGRRIFCRTHYSDLDDMQDDIMYSSQADDSFDNLLREAKAKLKKRKFCT